MLYNYGAAILRAVGEYQAAVVVSIDFRDVPMRCWITILVIGFHLGWQA